MTNSEHRKCDTQFYMQLKKCNVLRMLLREKSSLSSLLNANAKVSSESSEAFFFTLSILHLHNYYFPAGAPILHQNRSNYFLNVIIKKDSSIPLSSHRMCATTVCLLTLSDDRACAALVLSAPGRKNKTKHCHCSQRPACNCLGVRPPVNETLSHWLHFRNQILRTVIRKNIISCR